jgi:hypothetical protein
MMFALWGVSLARAPLYDGPVRDDVAERLKVRFIPSPNYSLVADDRYLFRVSVVNGDRHVQVWHNLALSSEADESGVVPNGPLADLF